MVSAGGDPQPFDPRPGRYRRLSELMRSSLVVAGLLAVVTVLVPASVGRWTGGVLVVVLVGAPLFRIVWFVVRWLRRGDLRYAAVGAGVLAVVTIGALLA
ncbi:MAG: hypothetical protein ACYC2O_00830 [Microthrixaceae bacterium]